MLKNDIPNEYARKINEVINFILNNLSEDLSLEKLAKLANYSPFHFQKIFKSVLGESPRQYIIRMRLQTAAHSLVVHQNKSVTEIAHEHGFSSSATFARSFKKYFGVTAEEYRNLTLADDSNTLKTQSNSPKEPKVLTINHQTIENLSVVIKKVPAFQGIFANAKLDDSDSIQKAFSKITQLAENHDLLTQNSKIMGAVYPHHNLYRVIVTIEPPQIIPSKLQKIEFSAGKYATFKTSGNFEKTFETLVVFSKFWLKENGYKIANIFYFEMFAESPVGKDYQLLEKETYNPIAPAD